MYIYICILEFLFEDFLFIKIFTKLTNLLLTAQSGMMAVSPHQEIIKLHTKGNQ